MQPRYVGGTIQGLELRLKQHIWSSVGKTATNYPVNKWVQSLVSEGITPIIMLICVCDTEDYTDDETAWIWFLWNCGCDLLNVLDGGQLGAPNRVVSQLTRDRLSKAGKGHEVSEITRKRISMLNTGKQISEEHKKALSLANKDKHLSEAQKQHLREMNLGKKFTQEHKDNISKSKSGKTLPPFTEEAKKNMSEARKGKKASDEARLNMSLSKLGVKRGPYKKKACDLNTIVSDNWEQYDWAYDEDGIRYNRNDNWPNQYLETI